MWLGALGILSTSRSGRNGLQGLCFWPVVNAQGRAQSTPYPRADGPKPRASLTPPPHPHNRPPAKAPFGLASGIFTVFRGVLVLGMLLLSIPTAGASDFFAVGAAQVLAGGGSGEGGQALSVSLLPQALALDAQGRLYIADEQYNRVRRIEEDGALYTVVGNGRYELGAEGAGATESGLYVPASLSFAPDGRLYWVDLGNRRVRVVEVDGTVRTLLDANTPEIERASESFAPYDVCVGLQGEIYVADRGNHSIWRRSAAGEVRRFAGAGPRGFAGDGGPATEALLADPRGVAVGSDGSVYIADYANGRVRRVEVNGQIGTWSGNGDVADWQGRILAHHASFRPEDIAVDSEGRVLIADALRPRLLRHEADFSVVEVARFGEAAQIVDVVVGADGSYWVADYGQYKVWRVRATGQIEPVAGDGGWRASGDGGAASNATLYQPRDVLYDKAGNLYIADAGNHRVRRVRPDGQIERVAGSGMVGFSGDGGPALLAQLNEPTALALDATGTLYIADAGNGRVRRIGSDGRIHTVAGAVDGVLAGNGWALQTALLRPYDVALDADGQLYIADVGAHRVYRLGADGLLRVIAGTGHRGVGGDGSRAAEAALNRPLGIEVDGAGGLYIAEGGNARIVHVDAGGTLRVLSEEVEGPQRLVLGAAGLVVTDGARHEVVALALERLVAPVNERVRSENVAQTYAALSVRGLLGLAYDQKRAALYVQHREGIERVAIDGTRIWYADFAVRRYSALALEEGLLVGVSSELGHNQPLTLLTPGPAYLPLPIPFVGVESLAQGEAVYVAQISGQIARLEQGALVEYAQLAPGRILLAAGESGALYALHQEGRALWRLRDENGDGRVRGPLEVEHLSFVEGEPAALAWVGGALYVGAVDGRIWRLEGRQLTLFAEGFAPQLLSISAGPQDGLYVLEGDALGGRLVHLRAPQPQIGIWPDRLDFGSVVLGQEAVVDVVLRNDGEQAAQLQIGATGDAVDLQGAITLEPGQVRRLALRWKPTRGGRFANEVVFVLADGRQALRLPMSAEVLAPKLVVAEALDFGVVPVGQMRQRTVLLRNDGRAPLHISGLEVEGASYQVLWHGPIVLAPGQEVEVVVELMAAARGAYAGVLRVLSNDVREAAVVLRGAGGVPVLAALPAMVDLGRVRLGQVQRQLFFVQNDGAVDLLIRDIRTGTLRFIVSPRQLSIAPGQRGTLRLDFRPGVHGLLQGELHFSSNDPQQPQVVLPFVGRGVSALLEIEQEEYAFAPQVLGESARVEVVLFNWSDRAIALIGAETNNAQFVVVERPARVAAGASVRIIVEYRPTVAGAVRAALVVKTDLPEALRIEVALSGRGLSNSRLALRPLREEWVPGSEWVLALEGENLTELRGLVLQLRLPGAWVELAGVDFGEESMLREREPLVVTERDGEKLRLGISLTGSPRGVNGSGELARLRFVARRPQAVEVVLEEIVLRSALGQADTLRTTVQAVVVQVAGDFDGSGALDLADFFLLADQFGQAQERYDLDGDGRVGESDAQLLLQFLGPAAKALVALEDSGALAVWPNPFNAEVSIAFTSIVLGERFTLDIYDALGRLVRPLATGLGGEGMAEWVWDGRDASGRVAASGVYFVRLRWTGGQRVSRLLLLR